MDAANDWPPSISPSSSPHQPIRPSRWRPARRTTRGSSAPLRPLISPASIGGHQSGHRATRSCAVRALHERGQRSWSACGGARASRVTLYGPPTHRPRTPTLSFTLKGRTSSEVADHLIQPSRVRPRTGDFYATTADPTPGPGRTRLVRAAARATRQEEVDRLVTPLPDCART